MTSPATTKIEIRDVQDGGVVAVGGPTSTITSSCPSSVKRLSGTVTAVTGDGEIPGYSLSQSSGRVAALRVHLLDRPRAGDDARPEPLRQHLGGEPGRRGRG